MSNRLYLRRTGSHFGRLAPKPVKPQDEEKVDDTPLPIQDQIEGLRTKIALKERYNKVIQQETVDSKQGATVGLQEAFAAARQLRMELLDAVESEKTVVQHCLRLYRAYQLAMTDRSSTHAIPWLKDNLFDISKKYGGVLNRLSEKRKNLKEAEHMIILIENLPIPGSLKWEKDIIRESIELENKIQIAKAKGSTAQTLYSTYKSIKFILREESGKYHPTMKLFDNQCRVQFSELAGLQVMLQDAIKFRESAVKDLVLTEMESTQNKKLRKTKMMKIRKLVDDAFIDVKQKAGGNRKESNKDDEAELPQIQPDNDKSELFGENVKLPGWALAQQQVIIKAAQIDKFRERLQKVFSVMRVTQAKNIPIRTKTVAILSEYLSRELEAKTFLKNALLFQKDQLLLILTNLRFTGQKQEELFFMKKVELENIMEEKQNNIEIKKTEIEETGKLVASIALGVLSIISILNSTKKMETMESVDPKTQLKFAYGELSKIARRAQMLRTALGTKVPTTDSNRLYIPPPVPPRHIRVGSPVTHESEDEESSDEEYIDSKIPGRDEIKSAGKHIIRKAIITKGLR